MPIIAHHVIVSAYGFWLPNDPRGSWSTFVRSYELFLDSGRATKVNTTRSVADRQHDHVARHQAKDALHREPVRFTGEQALAVAKGFADYCQRNQRPIYALAVLPDHAHLVLARSDQPIEQALGQLKARATMFLNRAGLHPCRDTPSPGSRLPTPWARNHWVVYLDEPEQVAAAIDYVDANPVKAGLPPQKWSFVSRCMF